MRGIGRVRPWLSLLSLTIFLLSFPLAAAVISSSCDLSYILLDEFGQETSVARTGGSLFITCKTAGSSVCPSSNITGTEGKDGKFEITIKPEMFGKYIRCCCANGTESWNYVKLNQLPCIPSQGSNCSNTELCHQKSDRGTVCKRRADVCLDTNFTRNSEAYRLRGISLWRQGKGKTSVENMEYCEALMAPKENDQVEVEVKGPDVELLIFSK